MFQWFHFNQASFIHQTTQGAHFHRPPNDEIASLNDPGAIVDSSSEASKHDSYIPRITFIQSRHHLTMKSLAILYICTGKYDIFWKDFYASSEKHFCKGDKKHYYVFTDSKVIQSRDNVTVLYQDNLGWPMIACYRYRILLRIEQELEKFDAMAFFNANALFVDDVSHEEFFSNKPESLVCVLHPLFPKEKAADAPFEQRPLCTAYVPPENRKQYCQSAISAGTKNLYMAMLRDLAANTEKDLENGIVATWHDESQWNAYVNNNTSIEPCLHILSQSYMYPESYDFPYAKKILMRDKHKHGGHTFLRGQSSTPPANGLFAKVRRKLGSSK